MSRNLGSYKEKPKRYLIPLQVFNLTWFNQERDFLMTMPLNDEVWKLIRFNDNAIRLLSKKPS